MRLTTTTMYRIFGARKRLLYIGVAGNPGRRFEQHAGDKRWWGEVETIVLEHFEDRLSAFEAERAAIIDERPAYNVIHNRGARSPILSPEAPSGSGWFFDSVRGGYRRRNEQLWLYPELNLSSCIGDVALNDGQEELEYFVGYVQRYRPEEWQADAVSIYWSVQPVGETAPFSELWAQEPWVEDFLTHYTWPVDANDDRLDWFTLPVRNERFSGFAKALGWMPSQFQSTAPLRSIITSRSGS